MQFDVLNLRQGCLPAATIYGRLPPVLSKVFAFEPAAHAFIGHVRDLDVSSARAFIGDASGWDVSNAHALMTSLDPN